MSSTIDPLDEEPYDPLDEAVQLPMLDLVRGGSDPVEGFGGSMAEARERAARLQSMPRSKTVAQAVTARKKRVFLASLSKSGILAVACAAAGWCRDTASALRKKDEGFSKAWDEAIETFADMAEGAMFQRAVHGVQEEVWHKPKDGDPIVIGYVTKYSDQLMALTMKGLKKDKYRENHKVEHDVGSKGGVLVVPGIVPLDEWTLAAARQQAKYREKKEDDL